MRPEELETSTKVGIFDDTIRFDKEEIREFYNMFLPRLVGGKDPDAFFWAFSAQRFVTTWRRRRHA